MHIHPPVALNTDSQNYFSQLGKQCGLLEVRDEQSFEFALETRLKQNKSLFLLVSRFEQGAEEPRKQLACIIRGISANLSFHVILCGGEKLADLKYKDGKMSLLNHADVRYLPELSASDIETLSYSYDISLDEELAHQFLSISGGDIQLLKECLMLKKQFPNLPLAQYSEKLSQTGYVYGLFTPLRQEPNTRQKVYDWLQKEEVGKAEPYILDDVLRNLYWKNLVVEREGRLYWRCETVRMAGQQILAGGKN